MASSHQVPPLLAVHAHSFTEHVTSPSAVPLVERWAAHTTTAPLPDVL